MHGSSKSSNTTKMTEQDETLGLEELVKAELQPANTQTVQGTDKPQKLRQLQWVKGDKIGNVETVVGDDGQWLKFASGNRISKAIMAEFMLDISEGVLASDELTLNAIAHKPAPSAKASIKPEPVHKPKSPVTVLLERSSQQDEVEVQVTVRVKSPTGSLMTVLRDSFGEEADQEVEEYMMGQINAEGLAKAAREEMQRLIQGLG